MLLQIKNCLTQDCSSSHSVSAHDMEYDANLTKTKHTKVIFEHWIIITLQSNT